MPFALMNEPSQSEVSEAINYLLANFGSNIAADPNTGEISGPSGIVIAYLYRYLAVKYADSFDGSVNFGDSPTNRLYYGLRNSDDSAESTNFADYIWFKVAGGGFGTTKFLWYQTNGGRQIDFFIGTAAPSASYLQAPTTSIDLDTVTGTSGKMYAAPTIYIWTANSTPPTRPSTTSTYTWATGAFTAPSGWSTQIPNNTTAGSYLWALAVPLIESVNTVTSVIDWTNVAYPIVSIGINGSSGPDGTRSASGFVYYALATNTAPAAPTLSGFNFTTGTFSTISANWSTTFTAPSATSTTQFWAVRYAVSEATFGGTQTVTVSTVFNWTNFNGLVTFTNLATNTGTTFIDGGNINTNSLNADRISSGNMVSGTASSAWIQMGQSGTVIGTLKSSLNVRKQVADLTLVNIAAQNNLDGNVTIWGHSANNPVGNGNGVTGSHTSVNTFNTWQRLGALGSGLADSAVWGVAYAPVSTSKAGVFERYSGTDSSSVGTLNKSIQLATNNYCAYSPSGQGKIYIVDGNGPFTGFHEGMIDIADPVEIGDIVVDLSVFYRYNISNVLFQVERSTTANQGGALGVVANRLLVQSSVPGVLWIPESTYTEGDLGPVVNMVLRPEFNLEELQSTYKVLQVNAVGEGQINVCGENGNINAGDLIVCSSIAGKGMKQSDDIVRSISVAKARESVTFSSPTDIQQIACIYISG